MVQVAQRIRQNADAHRKTQVALAKATAATDHLYAVFSDGAAGRSVGAAFAAEAGTARAELGQARRALGRFASGSLAGIAASLARYDTAAEAALASSSAAARPSAGSVVPGYFELERALPIAGAEQDRLANRGNRWADVAFLATLGIGLGLTFLLLWRFEVLRRRHRVAARERELEGMADARVRALVDHASETILTLDPRGKILSANAATARTFGRDADQLVGGRLAALVHPDDLGEVAALLAEAMKSPGESARADWRLERRDGSELFVEALGTNLLDTPEVQRTYLGRRAA